MKIIKRAYSVLRKYPMLTGMVLTSIAIASIFEGASFGMLIPLIQGFTNPKVSALANIPIINKMGFLSSSADQPKAIAVIFLLLFVLLVIKNIFTYISNVLIARLRFGLIRDLGVNLMNKLIDYDMAYFNSAKTGHLISSVNVDTDRIGNFILSAMRFTALLGRVLVYIVLLFLISVKISILVFILVTIVLLPLEIIVKKLKRLGSKISQAAADYNYKLIEIFTGIRLIKTCGTEELEKNNFKMSADHVYSLYYKSNRYIYLLIPISEVVIFALITLFLTVLFNNVKVDVTDAFPYIAAYLVVLVRTLTQLNLLNSLRSEALHNSTAFDSYENICDEKDKKRIKNGKLVIGAFSDSIKFKYVNFAYSGNKNVLDDINIIIPKGKVTAIVGASGVGKSTIVNLILRFYDVTSGALLVDGVDIKELDIQGWRKRIGLVSQDIFLFNTTVKKNISYGLNKINDEDVFEAARKAFAHDFITALPERYDTILGERGVRLSGGQKQRISIARAIVHNPEILILDEATSSLDTETELLIKKAIDRLTSDRTVIAIAHRLSTIVSADNIIVLEEGRVVESGAHPDLIGRNGLYKRLYDTQFNTQKTR